jgi:hypothetical protein
VPSRCPVRPAALSALCSLAVAIAAPSVGAEDMMIFFEVALPGEGEGADTDIYAQCLGMDGTLLWNEGDRPVAVARSTQREASPVACSDGASGAIVVFEVEFLEGEHAGDVDIYAQRLDSHGTSLWNGGEAPQPVAAAQYKESSPVVVSDGAGGAIVVYEWTDERGDTDILAQRIDAEGNRMWNGGDFPAVLFASEGIERAPVVVTDGSGGVIVVCEWEGPGGDTDVMAQRVSAEGEVLWNRGEQAVDVTSGSALERRPVAVPDGEGGALVAFEFEFPEGEHEGDVDIGAQRISGDGVRLWNGGERPAVLSSTTAIERQPTAVTDGGGGMIVAFECESLAPERVGDIDVLAQRVDGDGRVLWNDGDVPMVVSGLEGLERAPRALAMADGSVLVVFEHEFRGGEFGGDIDIMGSRISPAGEPLWAEEGRRSLLLATSRWLDRAPCPVSDGEGGVVVVYTAIGPEGEWEGDSDIEAIRLSAEGEQLWHDGEAPTDVSSGEAVERHPVAVRLTR